jgi:acyl dehydratase
LKPGLTFELGSVSLNKDEIIEFASKYDPQKFHLDEAAAKPMFGGLIASGWQTASLFSRLLVDSFLGGVACLGSPGVDEIRFLKPVFADKPLAGKLSIGEKKLSKSRPDRGTVILECSMIDESDNAVFSMKGLVIIACKPTPAV